MAIGYDSSKKEFSVLNKKFGYYSVKGYCEKNGINHERLPFSIKILLENNLRKFDGSIITKNDISIIAKWQKNYDESVGIAFYPSRVIMQDFTGVPAVVDLAAMRDAIKEVGGDPKKINPLIPVDLVIDHSIQTDSAGSKSSLETNMQKEFERNSERYKLLKWAQKSFSNMKIFPPGSGIIHQINIEYIGKVALESVQGSENIVYPDSVIGTDSHTTMINGLGIMGWGVGGIEAEAVMLGQPYYMKLPEVIGVKIIGCLSDGVTTTDLALSLTEMLRKEKVVEKFVEYFGEGYKKLSLPERATIANMSPEYGATMGFCPIDEETIRYLESTNREDAAVLAEEYAKQQGMFYYGDDSKREYTKVIEFDLCKVVACVAGPSRPQDRIPLKNLANKFPEILKNSYAVESKRSVEVEIDGEKYEIGDGSVVIASITSCTNTSNPSVLLQAGLVAKKAYELGLKVPKFVKTSYGGGSKVADEYLEKAGVLEYLEKTGFANVGYGCLTCIGNSGPLDKNIERAIADNKLVTSSVLSGNRNFEARVHQSVKTNFLASPPLVVVYAFAGRSDIDLDKEPIGKGVNGFVYFKDIWPSDQEVTKLMKYADNKEVFKNKYSDIFKGTSHWKELDVAESDTFEWDENSTYIRKPDYFKGFSLEMPGISSINNARPLLVLGDSVTTDHISPAGAIRVDYPAGKYLLEKGVTKEDFNSYGSRRGNHEVMVRGTFANVRIKNKIATKEGGYTTKYPENAETFVFDASQTYANESTDLVVLAGKEYGTGSSRDWAAKGPYLLGVKAVIAESYERIHRSNLVGMGILPFIFSNGENVGSLGLKGDETFSFSFNKDIKPGSKVEVKAVSPNGKEKIFTVISRIDTDIDCIYCKNGGILQYVLRELV